MRTMAGLIALSLATLLFSGTAALARQHGQVVIGNGFAFDSRPAIVVPRSRTITVERPFVERRFFADRPIIVERPVVIERRFFHPRREFFFSDPFCPFD